MLKLKQGGQQSCWHPIEYVRCDRFDQAIKQVNKAQYIIADFAGVSCATVSNIRKKKTRLSKITASNVAEALRVTQEYLMAEDISKEENDLKSLAFKRMTKVVIADHNFVVELLPKDFIFPLAAEYTSEKDLDFRSVSIWLEAYYDSFLMNDRMDYQKSIDTMQIRNNWHKTIKKLSAFRFCEQGKFNLTKIKDIDTPDGENFSNYLDQGITLLMQAYTDKISMNELSDKLYRIGINNGSPETTTRSTLLLADCEVLGE